MGHSFQEHLTKQGILHQTSCPYTPQQNGVAERKNRHLMEVARLMMFHRSVPKSYWGDAITTACYLINRIPTKILQDKSPFEVLNNSKPSINHIRVFGCVCYVLVPGELRNKLEAKSKRCVFLGYSTTQKGYKCYHPEERKIHVSRDVKFMEEKGYFDAKDWDDLRDLSTSSTDQATNLRILFDHLGISRPNDQASRPSDTLNTSENSENQQEELNQSGHMDQGDEEISPSQEENPMAHVEDIEEVPTEVQEPRPLRRSTRIRKDPSNWINTRVYFNNQAVAHPIQGVCSLDLLPPDHAAFLGKIEADFIPQTYEEAKGIKEWNNAVKDEAGAMERNRTWYETELLLI